MKAKIVTFDSIAELKSWFDLRGDDDRMIIYSHRENLPNNMVKYEAVVVTRQGTQRIPEKATAVAQRVLARYTGTLGITTKLAEGIKRLLESENATGTILPPKQPTYAERIITHLKEYGREKDAASINSAINYNGPGLGSIYSNLTKEGKIIRVSRGNYIHPDYYQKPVPTFVPQPPPKPVEAVAKPEFQPEVTIPLPSKNGANGAAFGHRLVIESPKPVAQQELNLEKVVEWLGSMAVRLGEPKLFASALEIKAIVNGGSQPKEEVIPLKAEPVIELVAAPTAPLTRRQLDFAAYLKDKAHRDVTPQELVENVLGKEWQAGQRHRFIYDTDMLPNGWYRTREDDSNVWRHESRRRVKRAHSGG